MSQNDLNTYSQTLPVAQAGQKVDLVYDQVASYAAEGAVPYGRGLVAGTDSEKQVKVADAAGLFLGVSVFTHAKEQLDGVAEYRDGDTVSALQRGRIWVEVIDAVAAGDDAHVVPDAGANQGKFAAAASGNLGPVGIFLTAAQAGELAQVELNGPVAVTLQA